MALLKKTSSGRWKARKAIPADVREEYETLYNKRLEEIFHAPATDPKPRAEMRHREWLLDVEVVSVPYVPRSEARRATSPNARLRLSQAGGINGS
jgi:hypothetical protein